MIIKKIYKLILYLIIHGYEVTYVKSVAYLKFNSIRKKEINNSFTTLKINNQAQTKYNIAIIGCGNFSFTNIAFYLTKYAKINIKYSFDKDLKKALILSKYFKGEFATNEFNKILDDDSINKFFIATNHQSHFNYAKKILLARDKPEIHIEKPHVVNFKQYYQLKKLLLSNNKSKIYIGFNRPYSKIFSKIKNFINLKQSYLINISVFGHILEKKHWYYEKKEGGRIIGNLSHWIDLCIHILGVNNIYPYEINPMYTDKYEDVVYFSINFKKYNSLAMIKFNAKKNDLLGVRENIEFNVSNHKIKIQDFNQLFITSNNSEKKFGNYKKFLGHKENILNSFNNTKKVDKNYIFVSAKLFLSVKQAFESNKKIKVTSN